MADELQRESGMSAADARILRSYVSEDPSRIDGFERFTAMQNVALIGELRGRGAHLHDGGKDSERELDFLMLLKQMKDEEARFSAS